jgi:hypothetical protein
MELNLNSDMNNNKNRVTKNERKFVQTTGNLVVPEVTIFLSSSKITTL